MRVELLDALGAVGGDEFRPYPGRHWRPLRLARREVAESGQRFASGFACSELLDDVMHLGQPGRRGTYS